MRDAARKQRPARPARARRPVPRDHRRGAPATRSCSTPGAGCGSRPSPWSASSSPTSTWWPSPTPTCPSSTRCASATPIPRPGRSCGSTSQHFGSTSCLETNPMTDTPLVLAFDDERCRDVELAGGKGASLASMTANGLAGASWLRDHLRCVRRGRRRRACSRTSEDQDLEAARDVVAATRAAAGPDQGALRRAARRASGRGPVLGLRRGRRRRVVRRAAGDLPVRRDLRRGDGAASSTAGCRSSASARCSTGEHKGVARRHQAWPSWCSRWWMPPRPA